MRQLRILGLALGATALFVPPASSVCAAGARRLRVPEECASVAEAVAALADGGTVDVASGTYGFGAGGLDLGRRSKAITLRARVPGQVTFSGGGANPVVRIDQGTSGGPPVVFEGIRFANGHSALADRAGGVTLSNAEATFVDCAFEGNRHVEATTGGGALGLYGGSRATIVRTTFSDNAARNGGGAIYAVRNAQHGPSAVWILGSTFERNSTAGSGFTRTSSGGAVYARDVELRVADSSFLDNTAGWVGGAIYAWGHWSETAAGCDYAAAAADVLIVRSRFERNHADDDAEPALVPQTQGGAIHAESCARLRVHRSLFEENVADWGGAVSVDHVQATIEQTVFRHNRTTLPDTGNAYPMGGAFLSLNGDTGEVERPTPELVFRHVLVQGGIAGDPAAATGQLGGCLSLRGDTSKPVPVSASARVRTTIADSAFVDCGVGRVHPELALIRGGAIDTNRADLRVSDTLFLRSRADGGAAASGRGAGLALRDDSVATFTGSVVFAHGFADVPGDSPDDVDLYELGSSHSGAIEEWAERPPATAGMLVAAPSRPAAPGGPLAGEAYLAWAWAGAVASLDGDGLTAREGLTAAIEGDHQLVVEGLGACARCSAEIAPPLVAETTLAASPADVEPGQSTTLVWTTPAGTFLAATVDRGLGPRGANGSAAVAPGGSSTYRRLALTAEGGALAEATVRVGSDAAPTDPPLFAHDFEEGADGWDLLVP